MSMDKLQMIFNIDVEPICQSKWNICFNKKNCRGIKYEKIKPIKLENST